MATAVKDLPQSFPFTKGTPRIPPQKGSTSVNAKNFKSKIKSRLGRYSGIIGNVRIRPRYDWLKSAAQSGAVSNRREPHAMSGKFKYFNSVPVGP